MKQLLFDLVFTAACAAAYGGTFMYCYLQWE